MANDPEKAVTLRSVSAGGRFLRETRGTIGLSSRLTLLGDDDDGSPADICSWAAATQAGTQLYSPSQNVWRRCAQTGSRSGRCASVVINRKMGTIVSLSEVVDALESAADEMSSYVNAVTGQVITVTHEDLRFAEEDPLPDLPDWQRETVTEAKQVLESKEWLELPNKFEIHEWKIMDGFGHSLSAESERRQVADAIRGSGAFRNFKSTIRRLGVEEAWFAYKRRAFEDFARTWLAEHGLQVDATQPVSREV